MPRRGAVVAAQAANKEKENDILLKSNIISNNNVCPTLNKVLQKEANATHAGPLLLQTPRKRLFGGSSSSKRDEFDDDDEESEESKSYEDELMALKTKTSSQYPVVVTNVRRSPTPHPQSKSFGLSAALMSAAPISPTLTCEEAGDASMYNESDTASSQATSTTAATNNANNVTLTIPSNIPSRVELLAIYLQQKRE